MHLSSLSALRNAVHLPHTRTDTGLGPLPPHPSLFVRMNEWVRALRLCFCFPLVFSDDFLRLPHFKITNHYHLFPFNIIVFLFLFSLFPILAPFFVFNHYRSYFSQIFVRIMFVATPVISTRTFHWFAFYFGKHCFRTIFSLFVLQPVITWLNHVTSLVIEP